MSNTPSSSTGPGAQQSAHRLESAALYHDFVFCGLSYQRWTARKRLLKSVLEYVHSMQYPAVDWDILEDGTPPPLIIPIEEALRWLAEQEYVIGTLLLLFAYQPVEEESTSSQSASLESDALQAAGSATNCSNDNGRGGASGNTVNSSPRASTTPHRPPQLDSSQRSKPSDPHEKPKMPALANRATNPIRYAAHYVLTNFPHWGDLNAFLSMWNHQVRIVTQVACPERQLEAVVSHPLTGETIMFYSTMECGNLAKVAAVLQASTVVYQLWVHSDPGAEKKLWFRFAVRGCREGVPICLRIMNLSAHEKLYCQNEMKPAWYAFPTHRSWRVVNDAKFSVSAEGGGVLSFYVVPPRGSIDIHFAYCVPYGYGDLLCYISRWHAAVRNVPSNVRFEERVLCRTWDNRKLHLLIISSQAESCKWPSGKVSALHPRPSGQPPFTDFSTGKKVVLISGRVHPGEVTASHAVHGIITFLLSSDPRAELLREYFIFFVVPMLNPDGVARGHTRLDQRGNNLNDFYKETSENTPPTVAALKTVFTHLQRHFGARFILFMDFHSHVSKDKSFVFGNYLQSTAQCWNLLFPMLLELHTPLFSYGSSRFAVEFMNAKEGSARVQFGESLIHSYTVELTPFTNGELDPSDAKPCVLSESAEIGRACLLSLLDYCCLTTSTALGDAEGGWDELHKEAKRASRSGGGASRRR
jgi:hypothetical protein